MGPQPTSELWGIGKKTAPKLEALGIRTVEELATADEEMLAARFGPSTGPWLRRLGTGEDDSPVSAEPYVARGRGRERTFQQDIEDAGEIRREVAALARQLVEDLKDDGRLAERVVVKVRFKPFIASTHGVPLPEPSLEPDALEAGAMAALTKFELDRPVRLLGVRVELAPPA